MATFVAVCDARGFAAAARKLGLSPSVITRHVAGLEERLGARLLHRTTRSIRLTDAGARYLELTRRVLAEIEEAELSVREDAAEPRGCLVVSAPLLFGRLHVATLVSAFLDAYPVASADLRLSDRLVNLVEDGIDVAIRIGALGDSGLIAKRLGATRRVLVASPDYLAATAVPLSPNDLRGHRLIAFEALTPGAEWTFYKDGSDPFGVRLTPQLRTGSGEAALDRALAGGGITAAFCYQVAEQMRSGTLVEVLEPFSPEPVPIQAVFPTSRLLSRRVRAFIDIASAVGPRWSFVR